MGKQCAEHRSYSLPAWEALVSDKDIQRRTEGQYQHRQHGHCTHQMQPFCISIQFLVHGSLCLRSHLVPPYRIIPNSGPQIMAASTAIPIDHALSHLMSRSLATLFSTNMIAALTTIAAR